VSIGDDSSALYTVPLNNHAPAVFEYAESGTGLQLVAAQDENAALIGSNNPARRGRPIVVYANGLGPVNNRPPSGEPTSADPLARTTVNPAVTIGGRPAQVIFSGLTPASVGLYQINLVVADDTPTGRQPLVITQSGVESKPVSVVIQ
jgi:uncharacterized protein (TIGR03437 family)